MNPALTTGIELAIAGILGLMRHLLLEPRMLKYPKAPPIVLFGVFVLSAGALVVGFQLLLVWASGVMTVPPGPQSKLQWITHCLLIYKSCMLGHTIMQRYPVSVWLRNERWWGAVRCSRQR